MKKKKESAGAEDRSLKGTLIFVGLGLLATVLLGGLKVAFERSSFGHSAEVFAFELLQGQLPYFDPDNPVVVLDTADISRDPVESRKKLEDIIPALVKLSPLAIGVDWKFSPGETNYASPEDPTFFELCLEEKRKYNVPIFLGVGHERKAAPPNAWLGGPQYKELAASVGANNEDATRLPVLTQKKGRPEELPLLGYALAKAYAARRGSELPKPPSWISWAVEEGEKASHGSDFVYEERLVNYSNLEAMKLAAQRDLSAVSVGESGRKSYEGKIVILGDSSTGFSDPFDVPGVKGKVGGVLVHASAAYTFASAPLFEFRWWVRLLLDFVLAAAIVAVVAFLRHRHAGEPDFSLRGQQTKFVWASMLVVVVAGWLLVHYTHVMWLDFLLVLAALFLHPRLEGRIHDYQERRKRADPDPGKKAAVCLLAAVLAHAPTASAQDASRQCMADDAPAAVVVGVRRPESKKKRQQPVTCYFRDNVKQDWNALTDDDNGKRRLAAGQHLCCDAGCVLTILFCGTGKEFDVQNARRDSNKTVWWYTVLEAYQVVPDNKDKYKDDAARPNELVFVPANPDTLTVTVAAAGLRNSSEDLELAAAVAAPASSEQGRHEKDVNEDFHHDAARAPRRETAIEKSSRETADASDRSSRASDRELRGATVERKAVGAHEAAEKRAAFDPSLRTDRAARVGIAEENWRRFEPSAARRTELSERYADALRSANTARDAKEYALAAQSYTLAQELLPGDARAFYGLGNVYADQGRWGEALKLYRHAAALSPYSAQTQLALGYALLQTGEGKDGSGGAAEAEAALRNALALAPSNGTAYGLFNAALQRRGADAAEVEAAYGRLAVLAPYSVEAHLRLSGLLWANGKRREADEQLRYADTWARTAPELRNVAETFELRGHYEEAEAALGRMLSLAPDDAFSLYVLGRVRLLRKHYDEAVPPLKRAAELSPNGFAPRFLLGLTYLNAGRLPEAEQAFDAAASVAGSDKRQLLAASFELGRVGDAHAKERRLSEAVRVYEHALRFDPDDDATRQKLAAARATEVRARRRL